jgi:hypothetical protein
MGVEIIVMLEFIKHWLPLLDAAAKVVGLIAVSGLLLAYRQYKHSVRIAGRNEYRAAVELAAIQCAHYGTVLMKDLKDLREAIKTSDCKYLEHCKVDREGDTLKLDTSEVTDEDKEKMKKHFPNCVALANSLEGFAIPFAADVADNEVGFIECGRGFVKVFEDHFPLYCFQNLQHYYRASQAVYWRWRKEIDRQELEKRHAEVGKEFVVLSEKLVATQKPSKLGSAFAAFLHRLADRIV